MKTRRSTLMMGSALAALGLLVTTSASAADKPGGNAASPRTTTSPAQTAAPVPPAAYTAEILRDPASFRDRAVTLQGAFRGQKGNCKWSAKISPGDWVLDDTTGCIYVNGKLPAGLSLRKPSGEKVVVSGTILIKGGKPVIRAQAISAPSLPGK